MIDYKSVKIYDVQVQDDCTSMTTKPNSPPQL